MGSGSSGRSSGQDVMGSGRSSGRSSGQMLWVVVGVVVRCYG